jgi:hypothetical protein
MMIGTRTDWNFFFLSSLNIIFIFIHFQERGEVLQLEFRWILFVIFNEF